MYARDDSDQTPLFQRLENRLVRLRPPQDRRPGVAAQPGVRQLHQASRPQGNARSFGPARQHVIQVGRLRMGADKVDQAGRAALAQRLQHKPLPLQH